MLEKRKALLILEPRIAAFEERCTHTYTHTHTLLHTHTLSLSHSLTHSLQLHPFPLAQACPKAEPGRAGSAAYLEVQAVRFGRGFCRSVFPSPVSGRSAAGMGPQSIHYLPVISLSPNPSALPAWRDASTRHPVVTACPKQPLPWTGQKACPPFCGSLEGESCC